MLPLPELGNEEHPGTYFIEDRFDRGEMNRVKIQDRIITAGMGAVLPAQGSPARF